MGMEDNSPSSPLSCVGDGVDSTSRPHEGGQAFEVHTFRTAETGEELVVRAVGLVDKHVLTVAGLACVRGSEYELIS